MQNVLGMGAAAGRPLAASAAGSRNGGARRRKPDYDAIIVGGGGHGLATAYYLADEHGITSIAVLEKGWIGGGNTGRNTTIIRSNYLFDESARSTTTRVKLWEDLSQELNYNVMYSPRGVHDAGAHACTTCRCSSATSTPIAATASTTNG